MAGLSHNLSSVQPTKSFVRRVRSATRRKYTPEEKIRVVFEGFRREVTVNDLCRREGIKPHSYYSWTKEFMEAGKERLARDSVRDATRQKIHALKRENGELELLGLHREHVSAAALMPSGQRLSCCPKLGVGFLVKDDL